RETASFRFMTVGRWELRDGPTLLAIVTIAGAWAVTVFLGWFSCGVVTWRPFAVSVRQYVQSRYYLRLPYELRDRRWRQSEYVRLLLVNQPSCPKLLVAFCDVGQMRRQYLQILVVVMRWSAVTGVR